MPTSIPGLVTMSTITIDYTSAAHQGGGIGRFTRELIGGLARLNSEHRFRLFVAGAQHVGLHAPPGPQFCWRPTRVSPHQLTRIWHRVRLPLPIEIFSGRSELFHAPDFVLPPTLPRTRRLVMVHDLSFERVPETFTPWLLRYLRQAVPRSLRSADHIIANSAATRDDYLTHFSLAESQFTVIHGGVSPEFQPVDSAADKHLFPQLKRPFVLAVGTLQPRKNFTRLIEAIAILRETGCALELAIAGGRGWLEGEILDTRDRLGLQDAVHLLGYVPDAQLPALYRRARVFAYPSLYEGFGLPLLEAMACGTPTLTASVSSLPEAAGDAAIYIDQNDTDSIAAGLRRLHEDDSLRAALREKGFVRAREFTWARASAKLLGVYDMLLA